MESYHHAIRHSRKSPRRKRPNECDAANRSGLSRRLLQTRRADQQPARQPSAVADLVLVRRKTWLMLDSASIRRFVNEKARDIRRHHREWTR
jgi:hypothetical protein